MRLYAAARREHCATYAESRSARWNGTPPSHRGTRTRTRTRFRPSIANWGTASRRGDACCALSSVRNIWEFSNSVRKACGVAANASYARGLPLSEARNATPASFAFAIRKLENSLLRSGRWASHASRRVSRSLGPRINPGVHLLTFSDRADAMPSGGPSYGSYCCVSWCLNNGRTHKKPGTSFFRIPRDGRCAKAFVWFACLQGYFSCLLSEANNNKITVRALRLQLIVHCRCRMTAWMQYAGRDDLLSKPASLLYATYRVCSDHFTAESFMDPGHTRLTRMAVPSVQPIAPCK